MACLGLGDARSWRTVTCAILFVLIAWVCIAGHTDNDDQDNGQKDNRPISQHVATLINQNFGFALEYSHAVPLGETDFLNGLRPGENLGEVHVLHRGYNREKSLRAGEDLG